MFREAAEEVLKFIGLITAFIGLLAGAAKVYWDARSEERQRRAQLIDENEHFRQREQAITVEYKQTSESTKLENERLREENKQLLEQLKSALEREHTEKSARLEMERKLLRANHTVGALLDELSEPNE